MSAGVAGVIQVAARLAAVVDVDVAVATIAIALIEATKEQTRYMARWLDALDKLNDPAVNDKEKPSVHKDKAGGNGTSSKWKLNKTSTMANKKDFLDELRRQLKQKTQ
ncbi:hypothetical protein GGI10_000433 [Coemansia sp. RSA 2530]|nr:hypothetical protein GGI10_000433 [Coemansia sp. RSA 2530]